MKLIIRPPPPGLVFHLPSTPPPNAILADFNSGRSLLHRFEFVHIPICIHHEHKLRVSAIWVFAGFVLKRLGWVILVLLNIPTITVRISGTRFSNVLVRCMHKFRSFFHRMEHGNQLTSSGFLYNFAAVLVVTATLNKPPTLG